MGPARRRAAASGMADLFLSPSSGSIAGARPTGLLFEYFEVRVLGVDPPAGPTAGGTEVRVAIEMQASPPLRSSVTVEHARCHFFEVASRSFQKARDARAEKLQGFAECSHKSQSKRHHSIMIMRFTNESTITIRSDVLKL